MSRNSIAVQLRNGMLVLCAAAAPERLFESFLLGSGASARRAAAAAAPPAIPVRPQVKP